MRRKSALASGGWSIVRNKQLLSQRYSIIWAGQTFYSSIRWEKIILFCPYYFFCLCSLRTVKQQPLFSGLPMQKRLSIKIFTVILPNISVIVFTRDYM